jgi:hypothetical protein
LGELAAAPTSLGRGINSPEVGASLTLDVVDGLRSGSDATVVRRSVVTYCPAEPLLEQPRVGGAADRSVAERVRLRESALGQPVGRWALVDDPTRARSIPASEVRVDVPVLELVIRTTQCICSQISNRFREATTGRRQRRQVGASSVTDHILPMTRVVWWGQIE